MSQDNIVILGGSGYVNGDASNSASTYVKRGSNNETLQSAVVAGNTLPSAAAGGTGVVNGGFQYEAYTTLTGNTTLTAQSPRRIYLDATSGAFAVTLPLASTVDKLDFVFYKIDGAHTVTLTGNGSDNIQLGASTGNTAAMSTQGGRLDVHCATSGVWRAA